MITSTPEHPPAAIEDEIVERAINAVGAHDPKMDYGFDLKQHIATLKGIGPNTADLCRILETDPTVLSIAATYKSEDEAAVAARHRFEQWTSLVILVAITAAMTGLFLISVPPETTWFVQLGLAIAIGSVVVAFLLCFTRLIKYEKKLSIWLAWALRLALGGGIAALVYKFIPGELSGITPPIQQASILVLMGCVVVADYISGGMTARLLGRRNSLRMTWYEARGKAEANRRQLFMAVLNAAPLPLPAGTPASPVPLLSQQLEYFRRYQVEVQQSYYKDKSQDNQKGARRAELARIGAFTCFLLMTVAALITVLGKWTEQGARWSLPDAVTSCLIKFMINGLDDLAVLLSLYGLGAYGFLQLRSSLLRERVNHLRFGNALGQLRLATSSEPGKANLDLPTPLAFARRAAVRGERRVVEHIFRDVNRQLATEVGDWSAFTPHSIAPVARDAGAPPAPRLFSAEQLDAEVDFDRVVRDLAEFGVRQIKARKISFVAAKKATATVAVETRFDGKESNDTAQPGDWIVTNMDSKREIIRDKQGSVNTYVIRADRFPTLYDRDHGSTEHGDVYKAKGKPIVVIRLAAGFDIVAPWGERQQAADGYLARNDREVYGINIEAFRRTYEEVPT